MRCALRLGGRKERTMMMQNCLDLWAIVPEMLLAGLCIALVPIAGFARGRWLHLPAYLAAAGLIAAMILTARMLPWPATAVFCDTYAVDGFATIFKLLLLLGALITLFVLLAYFRQRPHIAHAPVALLFSTLGGLGLASAIDLGLIALFAQMLGLASYILVALVRGSRRGNEATLKFFIYAAVALAVMAYGLTFFYGLTGSLELRAIGRGLAGADPVWIVVAAGMMLIGYAFEMTIVPFHFWAPDVYDGATAPVTGFLSVVPKIAGFAGLLRFLLLALPGGMANWPLVVALLAAVTMTFANLVALRQSGLKRLLAYSSIAQAAYVLIAVAVAERAGGAMSAVGYYLAAYLFMNLGAFTIVAQVERVTGSDAIVTVRGLAQREPGAAAALALSLLSLAGIPPLAGFTGKVLLLAAAIDGGMTWLAVIAALNMALALYYYVAIIAEMYLKQPSYQERLPGDAGYTLAAGLSLAGTFGLTFLAGPGIALMQRIGDVLA